MYHTDCLIGTVSFADRQNADARTKQVLCALVRQRQVCA